MPILTFHNIEDRFTPGITSLRPGKFVSTLERLRQGSINFVGLSEIIDNPASDKVCLTFDDGFESFYLNVFPYLRKKGIAAAIFIPARFIGKMADWDYYSRMFPSRHLSAAQIEKIAAAGIEIGSHGLTHTDLTALSERMLRVELEHSRKILEDVSGRKVDYVSYPFGKFDERVERIAIESGYRRGLALRNWRRYRSQFSLYRDAVYSTDNFYAVSKKIEGGFLGGLERMKGAIINSYAEGTIILNRYRQRNLYEEAQT
jgi:peptidoglycan/xylan/chitin deacetylase (PgdA/CDA1 family)